MREIKFRTWHKPQGCMYFTQSSIGTEGDGWIESIDFEGKKMELGCQSDEGDYVDWFPFEDVELMQFTGLKDKNGKEIYEGDIVKFQMTRRVLVDHPVMVATKDEAAIYQGAVKWGQFGWRPFIDGEVKELEVIGNIYENPELLAKD